MQQLRIKVRLLVVEQRGDGFAVENAVHTLVVAWRGAKVPGVLGARTTYPLGVDELTALALAAREGDSIALRAFVRASQAEVWRLCAHLGGREIADDLTQDVYVRALGALPGFRGDSSARTWLLAIARRTVADALRAEQRRRRLTKVLRQPRASGDQSGALELMHLVRGLDDDRRTAFVLTQVLGLTYADAAEVCACPIGTIRSRVARAREELLGALGEAAAR